MNQFISLFFFTNKVFLRTQKIRKMSYLCELGIKQNFDILPTFHQQFILYHNIY